MNSMAPPPRPMLDVTNTSKIKVEGFGFAVYEQALIITTKRTRPTTYKYQPRCNHINLIINIGCTEQPLPVAVVQNSIAPSAPKGSTTNIITYARRVVTNSRRASSMKHSKTVIENNKTLQKSKTITGTECSRRWSIIKRQWTCTTATARKPIDKGVTSANK